MQYRKTDQGFEELAQMNVDFGGGLERLLAATNDVPDIFLLDLFYSAKQELERISGVSYGNDEKSTYAMRVILDHLKAALFLIGDGVLPSNKDQGYFVRRLIRRAVRYGNVLGIKQSFTVTIARTFISVYAKQYPNLQADEKKILVALEEEEKKFRSTLEKGLKEVGRRLATGVFTGKDAFDLFATYGFPLEMTQEFTKEQGLTIDEVAFREEFKKHQDLSRTASAGKFKGGLADHSAKVTALHTTTHLMLAGLRKELGEGVHQAGSNITEERTRFDFTHGEKVSREVLDRVENYVNSAIASQATVTTAIMDKVAAKEAGVEGSFWEKYPEKVTVYRVMAPDGTIYSQELCGGPHVVTTADIASFGTFKIIKEEASSAGVRRIKAVLQ
jgi:alanyl-tRNA synthetase